MTIFEMECKLFSHNSLRCTFYDLKIYNTNYDHQRLEQKKKQVHSCACAILIAQYFFTSRTYGHVSIYAYNIKDLTRDFKILR